MESAEVLALVGGFVDEELLARNEYLAAENEIMRSKIQEPIQLNKEERIRLAEIGRRIGLKALKDVSTIAKPETVMEWFRKLVAEKFDGSGKRNPSGFGRPKIDPDIEAQALKMARENPSWGCERIAGALRNLGYDISDRTVGNILKRNGVPPAPKRRPYIPWNEFVESHRSVLAACDFFTTEVLTPAGLIAFFVLFFIKIGSREVRIAGVTTNPDEKWMNQIARNIAMADWGFLSD
jgi:putative transposase